jgi:hypothetical protein
MVEFLHKLADFGIEAFVTAVRTPHGAGLPESALYAYAQKIHE